MVVNTATVLTRDATLSQKLPIVLGDGVREVLASNIYFTTAQYID